MLVLRAILCSVQRWEGLSCTAGLGELPLSYTHSPSDDSLAVSAYKEVSLIISSNHDSLGTDLTKGFHTRPSFLPLPNFLELDDS